MKLKYVYLLVLPSVMLLSSCSNQNKKSMDATTESADAQVSASDSSKIKQEAIDMIKAFYKEYTASFLVGGKEAVALGNSIKKKYLTKELIEKVDELIEATNADPIIDAQDFGEDDIKTLTVEYLSDNWYQVKYTSAKGSQFERTISIPVSVVEVGGRYLIDDITQED